MSSAAKFLTRILVGFGLGIALGLSQLGWDERTWPFVLEYGLVLAALAFAVTNYLNLRQRLKSRVEQGQQRALAEATKSSSPRRRA